MSQVEYDVIDLVLKISGPQRTPIPKRSILTSSPSGHSPLHFDGDEPLKGK